MKKFVFGLLISLSVSAVPAAAQIMSNPAQWYINQQIYSTRVFNGVVANEMLRRKTGGKRTLQNPATKSNQPANDYTAFKPRLENYLPKQLAAKSGGNARETEQVLEQFITFYEQTAQKDGFPATDLAYAFEYFVVNNYSIYRDLIDLPIDKDPRVKQARDRWERISIYNGKKLEQVTMYQERAIYKQFKEILGANPEIQKMTDQQKQETTEMLAIMLGINITTYMKGINEDDEKTTEQARQLAKQGLEKLLGVPVEQIKITNNGLEL